MSTINTRDLPTLRDYAHALEKYNSITPIRGRSPELRPLGDRRKQLMRVEKKDNGDIRCILYSTACVIYHPDNTITINAGWVSRSTAKFIDRIIPFGGCFMSNDRLWFYFDGLVYLADELVLDITTRTVRLSSAKVISRDVADKEARRNSRKLIKESGLLDYLKTREAVWEGRAEYRPWPSDPTDPDGWDDLAHRAMYERLYSRNRTIREAVLKRYAAQMMTVHVGIAVADVLKGMKK